MVILSIPSSMFREYIAFMVKHMHITDTFINDSKIRTTETVCNDMSGANLLYAKH